MSTEAISIEGIVVESLSDGKFRVELPNGHQVLAGLSDRIRLSFIKIWPGDRVLVELARSDPSRGGITYRFK